MRRIPKDMTEGCIHKTSHCGKIKIAGYEKYDDVSVVFVDTGYEAKVTSDQIRKGKVKDKLKPSLHGVGFLGDGIYPAMINNSMHPAYSAWSNMIYRCYAKEALKTYPTYSDCEVCEEWQEYQEFAKWYEENYPKDGLSYELDKDIKIEGNRIYSPETCLFVTQKENATKANAGYFSVKNPKGERVDFYNLSQFCRDNNLTPSALSTVLSGSRKHHKGWAKCR